MLPLGKYCGQQMQLVMHVPVFTSFFIVNSYKRSRVELKAPVFNRSITYQTKEKGLTKVSI
jgi:hypothetical protein